MFSSKRWISLSSGIYILVRTHSSFLSQFQMSWSSHVTLYVHNLFSSPLSVFVSINPPTSSCSCFNIFSSNSKFTASHDEISPVLQSRIHVRWQGYNHRQPSESSQHLLYLHIINHVSQVNAHMPWQWNIASNLHYLQHIAGPSMGHTKIVLDLYALQISLNCRIRWVWAHGFRSAAC